ncbi:uncharacterized protein BDW70DRAFT_102020 [Aspergillus foveolatus]|uniref:uncharacterized protein n=1 Tax=Aspergillus foveolatus TaxID=210207 RepID=UPI003CCD3CFE
MTMIRPSSSARNKIFNSLKMPAVNCISTGEAVLLTLLVCYILGNDPLYRYSSRGPFFAVLLNYSFISHSAIQLYVP